MTAKLVNGDYQLVDNRAVSIDYVNEVLQNAWLAINAKRGKFYPNKDFGSSIFSIADKQPFVEYAISFARQAVDGIDGVYVKSARLCDNKLFFELLVNENIGEVIINVDN